MQRLKALKNYFAELASYFYGIMVTNLCIIYKVAAIFFSEIKMFVGTDEVPNYFSHTIISKSV